MGAVAARLSDLVVVTSDNPRSENPTEIIDQIKRGIVAPEDRSGGRGRPKARETRCIAIVDRKEVIERAVREAPPRLDLLIVGKVTKIPGDRRAGAAVRRRRSRENRAGTAPRRHPGVLTSGVAALERK